ncbi:Conserved_hypothetical protein [Hexamita inflata]|uniref:SP-RING-type domain-containing protein n=1 Tax=Hexamita inflata TaxID=28002 RepID=A0AA86R4K5_9EUKA|nr:Conserved hypothetical protein [Hexamita inflata]
MQTAKGLQRFLNGVCIKPNHDFDVGLHLAKIMFSKKSDLNQKQLLDMFFFISSFFDKVNLTTQYYYMKQQQLATAIYELVNKPFKETLTINVKPINNTNSNYNHCKQQQMQLANIHVYYSFFNDKVILVPENQQQYIKIYSNFFSQTPDYSCEIPNDCELKEVFNFYKNQQQNGLTDLNIIKQLLQGFSEKYLFDLQNIVEIYNYGGVRQLFHIRVPLTQQVIKMLLKYAIDFEYLDQLNEIEAKNLKFDYIYQHQQNPKQWTYSSDLFEQLVTNKQVNHHITDELLNQCLRLSKLQIKHPFIALSVTLDVLSSIDTTITVNRTINQIFVQQKYERNAEDTLISYCDSQLLVGFTKLLTCYHCENQLDYLLQQPDWHKLFNYKPSPKTLKEICANVIVNKSAFQQYMSLLAKNVPLDVSGCYFNEAFQLNIDQDMHQNNSEIESLNVKISFMDPISQVHIVNPARGSRCHHVQPLDNKTFTLNCPCPLCQQPVNEILQDLVAKSLIDFFKKQKINVKSVIIDTQTMQVVDHDTYQEISSCSDWFAENDENTYTIAEQKQEQSQQQLISHNPSQQKLLSQPNSQSTPVVNKMQAVPIPRSVLYSKNPGSSPLMPQIPISNPPSQNLSQQTLKSKLANPNNNSQTSESDYPQAEQNEFVKNFQGFGSMQMKMKMRSQNQVQLAVQDKTKKAFLSAPKVIQQQIVTLDPGALANPSPEKKAQVNEVVDLSDN